jgi:glycosyltransferase involved in cell wall biosynthesis
VEWIGEVDDVRKNELLGRAAAMIVPIRWNEPFGIVFPEALACGTPVITCARGALPEIVRPDRTGFFITGVDDGVDAVHRLGEIDRAECRRDAEQRFSLATVAPRYLEIYRSSVR